MDTMYSNPELERPVLRPETHQEPPQCQALAEVIAMMSDKWFVMVLGHLSTESLRYNELLRRIDGISQRMLTLTLRSMEEYGLIDRTVIADVPVKVQYEITELGRSLQTLLQTMLNWAIANLPEIEDAKTKYSARVGK